MDGYLKCYYGYKNRGDELLAMGIIQRIFHNYDIRKLYIEAGDERWLMNWLKINAKFLDGEILGKIKIVKINRHKNIGSDCRLFLGGGEVFTDQRPFPYDGWNYLLKFRKRIFLGKFVVLGGIGKIRKIRTSILYNIMLRKADKIVCREKVSFELAKKYNKHTVLYHDFALDVMDFYKNELENKELGYVLINVNSHIMKDDNNVRKIFDFVEKNKSKEIYFFPCDFYDDLKYFEFFGKKIPNLKLYEWIHHSIKDTLDFFAGCDGAIGTRLHFLMVLKYLGKRFETIVYQEKIEKLILQ